MMSSAIVPFPQRDALGRPSSIERVTPQALEAEQSTLGAMLMSRLAIVEAMEKITCEMFYRELHRKIWDAIIHLHNNGTGADMVTVVEELRRRNQLDEVGGPAYLTALIESCPSSANIIAYAKVVKDKFILRQFLIASEKIKEDVYSTDLSIDEVTARSESKIADLSRYQLATESHEIDALIQEQRARIIEAAQNPGRAVGALTGLHDLDRLTDGFLNQELIIIAGAPSMGKSALASQFATNIAKDSCRPVIIFSLEMSRESWLNRMVASEARVDSKNLRHPERMEPDEWGRVDKVQDDLSKLSVHIIDTPGITTADMKSQVRRISAMYGKPALVVIDYLQITKHAEYTNDERIRINRITLDVKNLARLNDCPVICLSQLNREVAKRENKRPVMNDLRESGAIEAEADGIIFVYRPSYYAQKTAYGHSAESDPDELILGKRREGETGMVPVKFIGKYTRFESVAREDY